MSPALMPACCSRSQMASTSCRLVEIPRPPRVFTFSPTSSPGRTSFFQASMGWSRSKSACMARSSRLSIRPESTLAPGVDPVPRRRPSRATTTLDFANFAPCSATTSAAEPPPARTNAAPASAFLRNSRRLSMFAPSTGFIPWPKPCAEMLAVLRDGLNRSPNNSQHTPYSRPPPTRLGDRTVSNYA